MQPQLFLIFFSTSRIPCDISGPSRDCGLVTAFDNPVPYDTINTPKKSHKTTIKLIDQISRRSATALEHFILFTKEVFTLYLIRT